MKRFLMVVAALVLAAAPATARAQDYVVVVNAASAVSSIGKDELSNVFLKKGGKLAPVDQQKAAKVRDAFSKASDADVIAYVKSTPNGIGYVAAGTELGAGVKAVTVQ
jgi:ABC-type phosphate transport system substrate-binding protein